MKCNILILCLMTLVLGQGAMAQPILTQLSYRSLPHPPVSYSNQNLSIRNQLRSDAFRISRSYNAEIKKTSQLCPCSNQLIRRVFDRIILANDLDHFFHSQERKLELVVQCPTDDGNIASSVADLVIISAPFVSQFMQTEDEVAMLLAHEISHVIAGAQLQSLYRTKLLNRSISQKEEINADENGIVMVARAGYDANTSAHFVKLLTQYSSEQDAWLDNSHPPLTLRWPYSKMFISRHELPTAKPTPFTFYEVQSMRQEVHDK